MDLYKWAAAFDPFLPAELVADCFAHAREIRALDMQASPYDLAGARLPADRRWRPPRGGPSTSAGSAASPSRGAVLRDRLVAALERSLASALAEPAPA